MNAQIKYVQLSRFKFLQCAPEAPEIKKGINYAELKIIFGGLAKKSYENEAHHLDMLTCHTYW